MWNASGFLYRFPVTGLVLLLVLGALGLPFPEDITLILGGFLIANGTADPLLLLLVVYLVMFAIDAAIFYAGRRYGPEIVNRRSFRRIISAARLAEFKKRIDRWGVLLIVLGRHVIVLRTQLIIAAGVFRMPPARFLVADAVTIPVTMLIMMGLGYVGANSLEVVKKDIGRVEHMVLRRHHAARALVRLFEHQKTGLKQHRIMPLPFLPLPLLLPAQPLPRPRPALF